MIYTLLLWITGCAGNDCAIPGYETQEFETLERCTSALILWQSIDDRYVGACVEGYVIPWEDVE